MKSIPQKPFLTALYSLVMLLGLAGAATAQSGTLAHRTATFANKDTARIRWEVPSILVGDPNNPPSTIVTVDFGKDGSGAAVDPGLPNAVTFCLLTKGTNCVPAAPQPPPAQQLSFPITGLPSGNTTISGKSVSVSSPQPGLFVLTILHSESTASAEPWELAISGLPVNASPQVRGTVALSGSHNGVSFLDPTGPCATGSCQAPNVCAPPCSPCSPCINCHFPWWKYVRYVVDIKWPFPLPDPPECPVCGIWGGLVPEGFERVLVSVTPFVRPGEPLGSGKVGDVKFNISGGEAIGPVFDAAGGRYMQMIQFPKGEPPRVSVSAAGVTSEQMVAVPMAGGGPGIYRTLTYVFGVLLLLAIIAIAVLSRRGAQPGGVARA
jgi:hypothetical protein